MFQTAAAQEQVILDSLELDNLYAYAENQGFDLRFWLRSLISAESLPFDSLTHLLEAGKNALRSVGFGLAAKAVAASAVLSLIRFTVSDSGSRTVVSFLCRIWLIAALSELFVEMCSSAGELIDSVIACSDTFVPVMVAASVLSGQETSAALLSPMMGFSSLLIQKFLKNICLPLACMSAGIAIAGNLVRNIRLQKMHALIGKTVRWASGGVLAAFLAIMTLQGRLGAARDSAAVRTTRYAIENLVPVVGGNVSDSLDALLATARMVKSAVGTSGLFLIVHICAVPIIELAAAALSCRIAAAVSEPLDGESLPPLLSQFADAIELLLVLTITASVLCGLLTGGFMNTASSVW